MCQKKSVPYSSEMVQYLLDTALQAGRRQIAACQPRDILEQVIDIAHYQGEPPELRSDLLDHAARNYFVKFKHEAQPR